LTRGFVRWNVVREPGFVAGSNRFGRDVLSKGVEAAVCCLGDLPPTEDNVAEAAVCGRTPIRSAAAAAIAASVCLTISLPGSALAQAACGQREL
jgi:hypothetical protein